MGQLDYGALAVPAELWRSAVGEGDDGVRAVEVHWLNGVVFTEVVFEDRLGPGIDFDLIEKHWDALYEIASRIERAVYEHFDLGPAEPSIWQTPLSLLSWDGSTSEHDALADALYTRAGRTKQPETGSGRARVCSPPRT